MNAIEKQFEHHFQVIRSERFRQGLGLGNEVPFFISSYPPEQQIQVDESISYLLKRLNQEGISVKLIDLFEFCIDLLEKEGVLDDYLEHEKEVTKQEFLQNLSAELNVENKLSPIIKQLGEEEPESILFLSGVGAIFPLIRTHTILTNLQSLGRSQPTVLFFPGIYRHDNRVGSVLDLFGILNEDRYYRAFSLNEYQI